MISLLLLAGLTLFAMRKRVAAAVTRKKKTPVTPARKLLPPVSPQRAIQTMSGNEQIIAAIRQGVTLTAQSLRGVGLVLKIMDDAGFSRETSQTLIASADGATPSGPALSKALSAAGVDPASTSAQQFHDAVRLVSQLIPYVMAALAIAAIAASDLQDDQKALASAAVVANLALTLIASGIVAPAVAAASGGAIAAGGVAAGLVAGGLLAPVAMGIMFAVSALMEEMQDIPHEVREKIDVLEQNTVMARFARELDQQTTWATLRERLDIWSRGQTTAFGATAIIIEWHSKGQRWPMTGTGAATKAQVFSDPAGIRVLPQVGVSQFYLDPWIIGLSIFLAKRIDLIRRVEASDPSAKVSMYLLRKRLAIIRARKAARQAYAQANAASIRSYEEFQRLYTEAGAEYDTDTQVLLSQMVSNGTIQLEPGTVG